MQALEIKFLQKIKEATILEKVRNTAIRKFLNIESLLLRIARSQFRWFGQWQCTQNALGTAS